METIKLSPAKIDDFRKKAESLVPRCFSGYNKDDPVCRQCPRSTYDKIEPINQALLDKMNEGKGDVRSFFLAGPTLSCENTRNVLVEKMRKIVKELRDLRGKREERDRFYLAEGSDGMGRVPVGTVREFLDFRDFTVIQGLVLYILPYASKGIVGEVSVDDTEGETILAKVLKATPELGTGFYDLRVTSQNHYEQGNLVLECECESLSQRVELILDGESAKRTYKRDDIGNL